MDPLPEGWVPGKMLGLNISPMIVDNEKTPGITMQNYKALISHILETTDLHVALIPHVVWESNDDRKPIRELYEAFASTGRVIELPDGSAPELKGYISRCEMFIGARTHATIAAYSSCVPTLVVGYSINDTIVVFDRIRENLRLKRSMQLDLLIDQSITQTLGRSLMTSITTLIVMVPMLIMSGPAIREFVVPLMVGIIAGAYSSIAMCSPLYYEFSKRKKVSKYENRYRQRPRRARRKPRNSWKKRKHFQMQKSANRLTIQQILLQRMLLRMHDTAAAAAAEQGKHSGRSCKVRCGRFAAKTEEYHGSETFQTVCQKEIRKSKG